jgi:hypothetical protein
MRNLTVQSVQVAFGLFLLVTWVPAPAQRAGFVSGDGIAPCGDYLRDRQLQTRDGMYADWIAGYMAAYNLFSTYPQVRLPDSTNSPQPTILAYVDKFCRDHPLSFVVNAADALIGDLGGRKPPPSR